MTLRRFLIALTALVVTLVALATGSAAGATPGETDSFEVRPCSAFGPTDLAAAPGEGFLFRACGRHRRFSSTLVHLFPSGAVVRQALPRSEPGTIVAGPGGEIWAVGRQ